MPISRHPTVWPSLCACVLLSCSAEEFAPPAEVITLDSVARDYVHLVLQLGEHDAAFVDAYYGPPDWREAARAEPDTPADIAESARGLASAVESVAVPDGDELQVMRRRYLATQLRAVEARAGMVAGRSFSFEEETRMLYGAVSPPREIADFEDVLGRIAALLPGDRPLPQRVDAFRRQFEIADDRLGAVFDAALAACRERTFQHLDLPAGESFRVEYVSDRPWGGYNWYQGDMHSLIQVNTDLPIRIDRAIDLGCHEGYPGHHTYNALLERHLVRGRGWPEFSVYALFSPQSLIAEGTATYGKDVAFPGEERMAFERTVLFPLAGLDTSAADTYYELEALTAELTYVDNEVARRYLDGEIDRAEARRWLIDYGLRSPEAAGESLEFIDAYRGYVINYNVGTQLVKEWVERAAAGGDAAARWRAFNQLLSSPRLPEDLQ